MIEITIFGELAFTLASALAFAFLLIAIGSGAYVVHTGALGLARLAPPRMSNMARWIGAGAGVLAFIVALSVVRAGGAFETLLLATALGFAGGALGKAAALAALRARAANADRRIHEARALEAARAEKSAALAAKRQQIIAGEDLRAEVAEAERALERLRAALATLVSTRAGLADKSGPEAEALRGELGLRIELGERVLAAAEAAAFRLACSAPVRRLVRRRPADLAGLSPQATGEPEARVGAAIAAVDAYLVEIGGARKELEEVAARRPASMPDEGEAAEEDDDASEDAEHDEDPAARARREIDAIETAYRAVRERADLARLRLSARAGMAEVASAAGAVSSRTRALGLDEKELGLLLTDVARAEDATAVDVADDEDLRALAGALARGAAALDQDDRASLDELLGALRSLG
jgi:predicted  nucleic acid-binding Zn-ribbon protein